MSKRKNSKKTTKKSKSQKLDVAENQQQLAVADAPADGMPTHISQLNDHSCFEIFGWLALSDVSSFAKACKWSRQTAASYFQLHHTLAIQNQSLSISGSSMESFRAIESVSNPSLCKEIIITDCQLTQNKIKCIKNVLSKVEIIKMRNCTVNGGFHGDFLKFCGNMKSLSFMAHRGGYNSEDPKNVIGSGNNWLHREYPTLENLELSVQIGKINEFEVFFAQNPAIRSFAVNADTLLSNRDLFMSGKVKLDRLAVRFPFDPIKMHSVINLISELHERGFYQRLHFYCNQKFFVEFALLPALEKLCLNECYVRCSIPTMDHVKELVLYGTVTFESTLESIADNLVNLERLYIEHYGDVSMDDLLPFFQRSRNLQKIRFIHRNGTVCPILNLANLNKQRSKLADACKVTIYVHEKDYLATKWATNKLNYDFVEIKRNSSYKWHNDFGFGEKDFF